MGKRHPPLGPMSPFEPEDDEQKDNGVYCMGFGTPYGRLDKMSGMPLQNSCERARIEKLKDELYERLSESEPAV